MKILRTVLLVLCLLSAPAFGQSESATRQKLATILLPEVKFKDVTFPAAIEFLRKRSVELDPDKTGVNFVLQLPADHPARTAKINLELAGVPLEAAVEYTTRLVNLCYKPERFAVVIKPPIEVHPAR